MSNEKRDRELGMHRAIPRRDFLNGVSLAIGMSITSPNDFWADMLAAADKPYSPEKEPGYYPPSKTGMRGSHDGSWEVAHAMRDGKAWNKPTPDAESHDLIVVGAGVSGLAAAYFYRKQAGPKARILILDNHDDFGGHAKRNEFRSGGRLLIGYGGTQATRTNTTRSTTLCGFPGRHRMKSEGSPSEEFTLQNSDAGAFAYANEAIDQGYRAVQEIMAKRT